MSAVGVHTLLSQQPCLSLARHKAASILRRGSRKVPVPVPDTLSPEAARSLSDWLSEGPWRGWGGGCKCGLQGVPDPLYTSQFLTPWLLTSKHRWVWAQRRRCPQQRVHWGKPLGKETHYQKRCVGHLPASHFPFNRTFLQILLRACSFMGVTLTLSTALPGKS